MQYGVNMLSESFRRGRRVALGTTAQNPFDFTFLISTQTVSNSSSVTLRSVLLTAFSDLLVYRATPPTADQEGCECKL